MLCVSLLTNKAMSKQDYTANAATSTIAKQAEMEAWLKPIREIEK